MNSEECLYFKANKKKYIFVKKKKKNILELYP